jgi:membrane associated rhomboid family serine protease
MVRIIPFVLHLQWITLSLARSQSIVYSIRGGYMDYNIELNPNYETTSLTTSRRNLILSSDSAVNHVQSTYYESHTSVRQKPKKTLAELMLNYAKELHRKSPVLYYGTTSSLVLWLLWQVDPLVPILQRHFVCSMANIMNGRVHTLLSSAISHASLGHLLVNAYAFILFGLSVQRAMIESAGRKGTFLFLRSLWPLCVGAALFGNISYFVCNNLLNIPSSGCIGGSSVTFALLAVDAKFYPSKPLGFIIHFFPIQLPAQYALTILVVLSALGTLGASIGVSENVSHASHLGGLLFGMLYYEILSKEWTNKLFRKSKTRRWFT